MILKVVILRSFLVAMRCFKRESSALIHMYLFVAHAPMHPMPLVSKFPFTLA